MPRTAGDLATNEAAVELIGPSENLHSASVMVAMPNDDDGIVRRNYGRMHSLLRLVVPEWANGPAWLNESVPAILRNGQERETYAGARRVSLTGGGPLPLLVLTVAE
jgi:hypothetical protein